MIRRIVATITVGAISLGVGGTGNAAESENSQLNLSFSIGYLFPSEAGIMLDPGFGDGALRGNTSLEHRLGGGFRVGMDVDLYFDRATPVDLLPETHYMLWFLPLGLGIGYYRQGPMASGPHFVRVGGGLGRCTLRMSEEGLPSEDVTDWLPHVFIQGGARRPPFELRFEYRFVKPLEGSYILDGAWPGNVKEDVSGVSVFLGVTFAR